MTRNSWMLALVLATGLTAPVRADDLLKIDRQTQQRLGIREAPLAAARNADGGSGFARGLDLTPLATLESDLETARAAAAASGAEAARTALLAKAGATVSRRVAEVDAAKARGDAARLTLLRRRVGLEWGPAFAAMSATRRAGIVSAVAAGRMAVVRVDVIGSAGAFKSVDLDLGVHGRARATLLGPARAGDPRATGPGVLALVTGPPAAWVGRARLQPQAWWAPRPKASSSPARRFSARPARPSPTCDGEMSSLSGAQWWMA